MGCKGSTFHRFVIIIVHNNYCIRLCKLTFLWAYPAYYFQSFWLKNWRYTYTACTCVHNYIGRMLCLHRIYCTLLCSFLFLFLNSIYMYTVYTHYTCIVVSLSQVCLLLLGCKPGIMLGVILCWTCILFSREYSKFLTSLTVTYS